MTTILKHSVGVDISKDKFDACYCVINGDLKVIVKATRKFSNSKKGFDDFDKWISKWQDSSIESSITMEATGVYYENFAWHLFHLGQHVAVVLPNLAKKYLQSLGYKSKTDKIDAKGLAYMGAERRLEKWKPLSKQLYILRKLTREHEQINKARTSIKNIIHAEKHSMIESKATMKRLQQTLALFDKQLSKIEKDIEVIIAKDELLQQKVENIVSIKGLGVLTAVTVIAETNGFELIKNQRQLVSYAGYDVVEKQSGTITGKTRISKKGNSHIRRSLFLPAFNTVRYTLPVFTSLYERLVAKGKTKMQAYVAIQKKLLILIYTLWRKDEKFVTKKMNILNQEVGASLLGSCVAG